MASKADERRDAIIRAWGCLCCRLWGAYTGMRIEKHHLVDKGYREHSGGEQATIPLCAWHHRGEPLIDSGCKAMAVAFGPSLKLSKRTFIATFGTERELLTRFDAEIDAAGLALRCIPV